MLKDKSKLILIGICSLSSILVIVIFVIFFNILTSPKPSPEELLELQFSDANETEDSDQEEQGGGLVSVLIPPKLSYFQFILSFSANMKNDTNIMNVEIALSTFEGDSYKERLTHHEPALRKIILDTIADTPETLIRTKKGKKELALTLLIEINNKLEELEEKPAIEEVHFSSFAIR